jgi:uncharacterized repeat protein (TIGR03803 family)
VFELTPPASGSGGRWTESVLYRFQGFSNGDGSNPDSPLILDKAGNLYGTTISGGGSCDCGTVFELSPPAAPGGPWTEAVLYSFDVDILATKTPLLRDFQGNVYGENSGGGVDDGSIYQLAPPSSQGGTWTYNLLYTFPIDGLLGASPQGGLAQDQDGNLYGAAALDGNCNVGSAGCGLIFELVKPTTQGGDWTDQVIYQFTGVNGDGMNPNTVAFHGDSLYGTTQNGGATSYFTGTIFKLSPPATEAEPWKETVLYAFDCSNSFGCSPQWGVIFDKAGNLYTTLSNGQGAGVLADIFELSPPAKGADWTPKVVYGFTNGNYGGVFIVSGVIFDRGNGLYGATSPGGNAEKGIVFAVLP